MIWTYMLTKTNEFQARDANSVNELKRLGKEVNWLWIDCMEPDDEELNIISGLLNETEIISAIRKRRIFPHREKVNDCVLLSVPLVLFKDVLETYPIYVFVKEKLLITVRSTHSAEAVHNTLDTFRDCLSKVCQYGNASSFIVSRLLHEVSDENLDAVMLLREQTDKIEEEALENPGNKKIGKRVFSLKRQISALERILWTQRELMLNVEEGVVPAIGSSKQDVQTVSHAVNNVSRQLSLLTSNDNALDSVLSLQDLGMIHRVEKILIYLTLLTLIINVIMIFLELNIVKIISG